MQVYVVVRNRCWYKCSAEINLDGGTRCGAVRLCCLLINYIKMPTQALLAETSESQLSTAHMILGVLDEELG